MRLIRIMWIRYVLINRRRGQLTGKAFNDQNPYGNTPANQLEFNLDVWPSDGADDRWLAETAHANGLALDLKNAPGLIQVSEEYKTAVVAAFDYNVIESCVRQPCSRPEFS
jgi:hypothetical protein